MTVLSSIVDALAWRRTHRRLTRVAADPSIATADDISVLMTVHGADYETAWEATDRIHRVGLSAVVLWEWAMAYDGIELARLLASEMPDYMVESALEDGIVIHRELSQLQAD